MTELEAGGPSLGNLLGFALVLREHRARLVLERRTLAVGVHLVDYEAVVSGIRFPLEGPVSAAGFRHRRCHVQHMTLEIERHALQAWLSARLSGRVLEGMRIEAVAFEPAVRMREGEPTMPWILLTGRGRAGGVAWFGCALGLGADGRCVKITPVQRWFIGRGQVDTAAMWRQLAQAIDPRRRATALDVGIDPAHEAVRIPFVRAGWKLPGLEQLALVELQLDDRRARASWRAGALPMPAAAIVDDGDAVAAATDRVRAALARGDRERACDEIDALVAAAAVLPAAQIAALRWGSEIAATDRTRRRLFARARLRLQPTDAGARRALISALAHPGDHDELVRHVRTWAQLAEGPVGRARCAIAIAGALAASGRHAEARDALRPGSADVLADEVRLSWPRLSLDDPEAALRMAHETFAEVATPLRIALWCDLAAAAADAGHIDVAWSALDAATPLGTDARWTHAVIELLAIAGTDDTRLAALAEHAERFGDARLGETVGALRRSAEQDAAADAEPHDADGWLARIDDAFAQGDLARAVAHVRGMLQALPMGADAFAAMSTRGIDAALAHGDLDAAIELLDDAARRAPDHGALAQARAEILALAEDPRLRVRLLADIARRHSGAARIEALEERARILADVLGEKDEASTDLAAAFAEAPDRLDLATRLADFHAGRGRWNDFVELLARVFPRQRGAERRATLLRMAAAYRDELGDLVHAEQALRHAIATTDDDDGNEAALDELAALLEQRGRWADLAHELTARVRAELDGQVIATPAKATILARLARLQRERVGDDDAAAAAYEALDRAGMLPEDGLACLAHAWRHARRFEDLVRLLDARAQALVHEPVRFAAARRRAAELLDGPLGRPLEAVDRFLDAHAVDPRGSSPRLRVLLVGVIPIEHAQSKILGRIGAMPDAESAPLWALLATVLSHHTELAPAAAAAYRDALIRDPSSADANEGLARLELRRGDIEAAWPHVCIAVRHPELSTTARADLAALAARALLRAGNDGSARALLELVLESAPDHVPALLEIARLHERTGDSTALLVVLEHLRTLPMSGAMRAEVLHRHALSLQSTYRNDPRGSAAEVAIDDVLEALRADPTHPGARQLLLEIARLRGEWSLVVAALEAVLRTLGPGPARARVELEIAELTLTGGNDHEAATRRLESAITEIDDDEVHARAVALAMRLQPHGKVATGIAAVVDGSTRALGPEARARIDRLVARLREGSRDDETRDGDADEAAATCARLEREAAALGRGRAAAGWLAVAAAAWHRLGDGERAARAVLQALAEPHDEREAARLIADVALACGDETTLEIYQSLRARADIGPDLRLQRASLARLLGRDADALEDLGLLCQTDDSAIRRRALAELDQILAQVGAPEQRIGVLRARFAELAREDDGELADVAAELARVELELGDSTRALATCRIGLRAGPLHRTLLRLQVELLELHDLPDDLVDALATYAGVCASPRERSRHLVRAARIVLDRGAAAGDADHREAAAARAAKLLEAAREADDDDVPARALALPLAFAAGRSLEVEALGQWLLARGRRDDPALVLAAISAARRTGSLELAAKIGQRDATTTVQTLLPALRQAATEVATVGPAERIDAVLAAASRLAGGPLALFDALRRWSSDRPLQAGLALALSRMHEAHGDPNVARMLLALAAFLAPAGPLERWLVPMPVREDEVDRDDDGGRLGGHSALRALLRASVAQRTDAWTNVVPSEATMPPDERRFREMFAHVGRFTGLAQLLAGDDAELVDRLDALATIASPDHRTSGPGALRQAEALAKRPTPVPLATRIAALDEIAHWLSSREHVARLRVELVRHWWLTATRKSHELRGALRTLAEVVGTRRGDDIDAAQTLRSEEARWLLGALELYGGDERRERTRIAGDPSAGPH
jgi:tetratricopeptide (TPR) repeat protein